LAASSGVTGAKAIRMVSTAAICLKNLLCMTYAVYTHIWRMSSNKFDADVFGV